MDHVVRAAVFDNCDGRPHTSIIVDAVFIRVIVVLDLCRIAWLAEIGLHDHRASGIDLLLVNRNHGRRGDRCGNKGSDKRGDYENRYTPTYALSLHENHIAKTVGSAPDA